MRSEEDKLEPPAMGKLLPFVKPTPPPIPEPFMVACADGSMSSNPMRRLVTRNCVECGLTYVQAARTGRCPNCHSHSVVNVSESACVAPYRK